MCHHHPHIFNYVVFFQFAEKQNQTINISEVQINYMSVSKKKQTKKIYRLSYEDFYTEIYNFHCLRIFPVIMFAAGSFEFLLKKQFVLLIKIETTVN